MGLATAHFLQQRGYRVEVFEAADRVGGMSAHFDFDGLDLERFYHFICKTDVDLFALLEELGLRDRVRWADTGMGLFYNGTLYEWGRPDALLRFPHLRKRDKLRYALHILRARLGDWKALDDVEATAWTRRWVGDRAYELLWEKSFQLKFFEHHRSISAAWIATRIRRVSLSRRDAFHEQMGYLAGGSEVLLDALCERITAAHGSIHLRSAVEEVLSVDGKVTGVRTRDAEHAADLVVSTVPMKFVPEIVPQLATRERRQIERLENIGVVCVTFKLAERLTPHFWININDPEITVPGVIEYTNLNPLSSHVVYVPYYMPATHEKWLWSDEAFETEAFEVLRALRPDLDASGVQAARVSRYRYAQPVCPPGFSKMLPTMLTSISGFLMADTSYCYPEDRSITESIRIARMLVEAAHE